MSIDIIIVYECIFQTVTKDQIKEIVDKHNTLRSDPKTTETAKQMCKVVSSTNVISTFDNSKTILVYKIYILTILCSHPRRIGQNYHCMN